MRKVHMTQTADTALVLEALKVEVLKEVRQELRDHRTLLLEAIDQGRSLERHLDMTLLALSKRVDELRDDLELVIKSEVMGLVSDLDLRGPRG
jgi:hypothetical protein